MQTTETLGQDKIMATRAQGIQGPVRMQHVVSLVLIAAQFVACLLYCLPLYPGYSLYYIRISCQTLFVQSLG